MNDLYSQRIRTAIDNCFAEALDRPSLQQKVLERTKTSYMSKKSHVALAAVVLLILLSTTAFAITSFFISRYADQRQIGTPISCTMFDNKIYYMSYDGICIWTPETLTQDIYVSREKLNGAEISIAAEFFHDERSLYLFDQTGKKIWAVENQGLVEIVDFSNTPLDEERIGYSHPVFQNDYLWLIAGQENAENNNTLIRVNLADMSVQKCWVKGVEELVAYGDNQLLALQRSSQDKLFVLSASSGNIRNELYTSSIMSIKGISCSTTNVIYAIIDGQLSYWDGIQWKNLQAITPKNSTEFYAVIDDGYVTVSGDGILFHPFGKHATEMTVLTIRGAQDVNDSDFMYVQTHPNVNIAHQTDVSLGTDEIRKLIMNGDETDIFHFRLDGKTSTLFADDLALELTTSQLKKDHEEMMDSIAQALCCNGAIYAIPSIVVIPGYDLQGTSASPAIPVHAIMYIYIVNPNSRHKEAAIDYLISASKSRSPQNSTYLKPKYAQPALYPGMQEWVADIEADQRALDSELGIETDEAALLERINAVMALPNMWEVTEDAINDYRENVAPYLSFFD